MLKYNTSTISKLDFYFNLITHEHGYEKYYINAMNNKSDQSVDKKNPDAFMRDKHNFCNWTIIEYFDLNKGFKDYRNREWFYVTETNNPEYVQLRSDLIDEWKRNNAKDTVIIVAPNGIIAVPMEKFYSSIVALHHKEEWNAEGNRVAKFNLNGQKIIECKDYTSSEDTIKWFKESSQFIGHCSYARHRTSKKSLIMASYDENGKLKNHYKMKSLNQFYEIFNVKNNLGISYKTFQRIMNKNINGYFLEILNKKVWLKVEDPASNAIPDKWGMEAIVESTESLAMEALEG